MGSKVIPISDEDQPFKTLLNYLNWFHFSTAAIFLFFFQILHKSCRVLTSSTALHISRSISHSASLMLSLGLLLSFGAMREPSSLPDGMAAVYKYQAALFPQCFPGDYQHCINIEVLSTEHTQTAHHHKTTHTPVHSGKKQRHTNTRTLAFLTGWSQ